MLKRTVFIILVLFTCLAAAGCAAAPEQEEVTRYTLYIGLNDSETHTQLIPTDEAIEKLGSIALAYVDGYTIYEATGGWNDENGVANRETCLVLDILYASEEQVRHIMDDVLREFNQGSVLYAKGQVYAEYYSGQP